MLIVNKDAFNEFQIYKSLFDYDGTLEYKLNLINDLSNQVYTTDLVSTVDNEAYTSIILNDLGISSTSFDPSLGQLILPLAGLYHLSITLDDVEEYKERILVKGFNSFVDDNTFSIKTFDDSFTIRNNNK
jgi:hypothetical protein